MFHPRQCFCRPLSWGRWWQELFQLSSRQLLPVLRFSYCFLSRDEAWLLIQRLSYGSLLPRHVSLLPPLQRVVLLPPPAPSVLPPQRSVSQSVRSAGLHGAVYPEVISVIDSLFRVPPISPSDVLFLHPATASAHSPAWTMLFPCHPWL